MGNRNFFKTGKEHPAYKNGTGRGYNAANIKRSIIILGEECQVCGSKEHVNLHHKDGNPKNNKVKNWKRMCASCHIKHHWYKRNLNQYNKIKNNPLISKDNVRIAKIVLLGRFNGNILENKALGI